MGLVVVHKDFFDGLRIYKTNKNTQGVYMELKKINHFWVIIYYLFLYFFFWDLWNTLERYKITVETNYK